MHACMQVAEGVAARTTYAHARAKAQKRDRQQQFMLSLTESKCNYLSTGWCTQKVELRYKSAAIK